MKETHPIQRITSLISLVLAVIALAGALVNLATQPKQLRITGLLGYVFLAGLIFWFAFRSSEHTPNWLRWAGLVFLYVVTILAFIWVGTWIAPSSASLPNIPLQLVRNFDFEEQISDPANIAPLIAVPSSRPPLALVSNDRAFVHSGAHSLRLKADIPVAGPGVNDYGGFGTTDNRWKGLTTQPIRLVTVWILLPQTEQTQKLHMTTHLMAFLQNDNKDTVGFYSKEQTLVPGNWTQLTLGLPFDGSINDISLHSFDGALGEFYLTFWSDMPYSGSVYIDDVAFYTDATTNP